MVLFTRLHWFGPFKMAMVMLTLTVMMMMIFKSCCNTSLMMQPRDQTSMSMEDLHQRMMERTALVNKTCQYYSNELLQSYSIWLNKEPVWSTLNASLLVNRDVLVNREKRLAWCKVLKVASTSLVQGLLRLIGGRRLLKHGQLHKYLRQLMPHPQPNENLNFCTGFMVVRHPFQRILSAYREKLMNRKESGQFNAFKRDYGLSIIRDHRKSEQPLEYKDMPTFSEFVDYLISTPVFDYNEHWLPYYLTCTPCHHHYAVILHLETLEDDTRYLVNITGHRELSPRHIHVSFAKPRLAVKTKEVQVSNNSNKEDQQEVENSRQESSIPRDNSYPTLMKVDDNLIDNPQQHDNENTRDAIHQQKIDKPFYSQITLQQLLKLRQAYKIDFEMFGYNLHPYDTYVI